MSRSSLLPRVALFAILPALGVGLVLLTGCGKKGDVWPKEHAGPKVVVSFAPLYCFAVNVAGDDAVVKSMMTTSGPHHFQPTDQDARLLRHADLFLVNGLGLEQDQPQKLAQSSGNKDVKIVDVSARIPEDKLYEGSCTHDHAAGEPHEHGNDPHVWLSPDYAVYQVEAIRDALKEADPAHADGYDRRAAAYVVKLRALKDEGVALLKDKKDRKLVTFHDSMTYFAKSFDLNIVGVVQKNPGSEPNDKALKKLIALCADPADPVRVLTCEPQYSTSNSAAELIKILAHKGVKNPRLVEIDPLETVTPADLTAGWYEERMRANLKALAGAME